VVLICISFIARDGEQKRSFWINANFCVYFTYYLRVCFLFLNELNVEMELSVNKTSSHPLFVWLLSLPEGLGKGACMTIGILCCRKPWEALPVQPFTFRKGNESLPTSLGVYSTLKDVQGSLKPQQGHSVFTVKIYSGPYSSY
jgi:hypothetical protein